MQNVLDNSLNLGTLGQSELFCRSESRGRRVMMDRAPVQALWAAVVVVVLGGQRTAPEDAQRRNSDR